MHLYIQLHRVCFALKHIQSAQAALVFCMSGRMTRARSITAMGPHPVGHIVLYGQRGGLNGQVTHWRVMFTSFNTEAVKVRLQQSFCFFMDFVFFTARHSFCLFVFTFKAGLYTRYFFLCASGLRCWKRTHCLSTNLRYILHRFCALFHIHTCETVASLYKIMKTFRPACLSGSFVGT